MSRNNTPRIQLSMLPNPNPMGFGFEMLGGTQITPTASPTTLAIDQLKPYPNHKYELYTGDKLL